MSIIPNTLWIECQGYLILLIIIVFKTNVNNGIELNNNPNLTNLTRIKQYPLMNFDELSHTV